jgi:hypothetical protein
MQMQIRTHSSYGLPRHLFRGIRQESVTTDDLGSRNSDVPDTKQLRASTSLNFGCQPIMSESRQKGICHFLIGFGAHV